MAPLHVRWLSTVTYGTGLELQQQAVAARRAGGPDTLLLLEHPPVITLGRTADPRHVLLPAAELARRGIECRESGRGGDVTYHGPGQLVGYPIVELPPGRRDAHRYLRDLEQALIATAADCGVRAGRAPGRTGVWVGRDKLAAIGVRLHTGWITSHGFAFNVSVDLDDFRAIVPCGIADRGVTSLARLLPRAPTVRAVAARAAVHLAAGLGLTPAWAEESARC